MTRYNGQVVDVDNRSVRAIFGMKVRWIVIIKIHPDDNPVEPAKLRHRLPSGPGLGRPLPGSFQ
jgi:hypothetical protein